MVLVAILASNIRALVASVENLGTIPGTIIMLCYAPLQTREFRWLY